MSKNANVMLFIVVLLLSLLFLFPFAWAFLNSFKNNAEIFGGAFLPKAWSLKNYTHAWLAGNFKTYLLNSMLVTLAAVILKVGVSVPAGYAFAKLNLKKYPFLFYVFLLGIAIPMEAFIIVLFYLLKDLTLINSLWGVILPTVATSIPLSVFIMRAFFMDLPDSLMESGKLDGAGMFNIFFKIMLPLSFPGVMVITIFGFLGAWNEYFVSILVLISPESRTIPIGIVAFFDEYATNYGAIFAGVIISIIPSILVYIVLQRSFIEGLTVGAVKE